VRYGFEELIYVVCLLIGDKVSCLGCHTIAATIEWKLVERFSCPSEEAVDEQGEKK
jgi:hypothetical protein